MEMPKCLTKKCINMGGTRGLCASCYSTARLMIKAGLATEEQIVAKGMMNKAHQRAGSLFKAQFLS